MQAAAAVDDVALMTHAGSLPDRERLVCWRQGVTLFVQDHLSDTNKAALFYCHQQAAALQRTRSSPAAHQELALLLPAGALGVGVPVGLRGLSDELPLGAVRLRPRLQRPDHLLPLPFLPVLLDQTPLGHALRIVQHHWSARERGGGGWRQEGELMQ